MKKTTILQDFIRHSNKREILLTGFYIFFLFVMLLAMILDYQIGNIKDAHIETFFVIITAISGFYYLYTNNTEVSLYTIIFISALTSYALLISNDYKIGVFHIIEPLAFFLLFTLKRALLFFLIHITIVIGLYIYGYITLSPSLENYHGFTYEASEIVARIMATLVIFFIGILYQLGVEDTYEELEKENYQKEILLHEINHRIKNNLQLIISMLGLQGRAAKDKRISQILDKTKFRIESISTIHEILYKQKYVDKVNFYVYITKLVENILNMSGVDAKVTISKKSISLNEKDMIRFGIITNELLTNSMKYAFKDNHGRARISMKEKNGHLIYMYKDNGQKKEIISKEDSLGFELINLLVKEMGAELSISMEHGFCAEIKMDKRQN